VDIDRQEDLVRRIRGITHPIKNGPMFLLLLAVMICVAIISGVGCCTCGSGIVAEVCLRSNDCIVGMRGSLR
jgi:hypothetical protein